VRSKDVGMPTPSFETANQAPESRAGSLDGMKRRPIVFKSKNRNTADSEGTTPLHPLSEASWSILYKADSALIASNALSSLSMVGISSVKVG
jgi:hypothetical protein